MIECNVDYYDGVTSKKKRARLIFDRIGEIIVVVDRGQKTYSIQSIVVSPLLGKGVCRLQMPDGIVCEILDKNISTDFLKTLGAQVPGTFIEKLESKTRYVIMAAIATVFLVWIAIGYGIPLLAKQVAFMLPVTSNSIFGDDILVVFDSTIFSASELSESAKNEMTTLFLQVTEAISTEYVFNLEFRRGGDTGPNAFALPTGTIVVTDELSQLISHPHELEAILAHEIGHVIYRHSLRRLIQGSTIALLIMAITGDVSTVSALASSLPTLITETYYSREFEREADRYCYEQLVANGIPPIHFANILDRISGLEQPIGFLSTHPSEQERKRLFSN